MFTGETKERLIFYLTRRLRHFRFRVVETLLCLLYSHRRSSGFGSQYSTIDYDHEKYEFIEGACAIFIED